MKIQFLITIITILIVVGAIAGGAYYYITILTSSPSPSHSPSITPSSTPTQTPISTPTPISKPVGRPILGSQPLEIVYLDALTNGTVSLAVCLRYHESQILKEVLVNEFHYSWSDGSRENATILQGEIRTWRMNVRPFDRKERIHIKIRATDESCGDQGLLWPRLPPTPTPTFTPPQTQTPTPTAWPTPTPTPFQSPKPKPIHILSHRSYVDSIGIFRIFGEVMNNGTETVEWMRINVWFRYNNHAAGGFNVHCYTDLDALLPGEKSPFSISFFNQVKIPYDGGFENVTLSSYKLDIIDYEIASEQPYRDFEIISNSSQVISHGLEVVGEVENIGVETVEHVMILATFYDREGKVIVIEWAFIEEGDIPPGESGAFKLLMEYEDLVPLIDHYNLTVQGNPIK